MTAPDITYWQFLRHIVLPGALPGIFLGLRFGVIAALGLVVVGQFNTTNGIGYMVNLARNYGQADVMLVGLVLYALLGLLSDRRAPVRSPGALLAQDPGPVSAPLVRVRGLTCRFTLKGVLNGIDLDIGKGEFVAVLGRSGSGKSTLLRAIADLDHEALGEGRIIADIATVLPAEEPARLQRETDVHRLLLAHLGVHAVPVAAAS